MAQASITVEVLSEVERSLVFDIAASREPPASNVYLVPFRRWGFSGAKLFALYFSSQKDCLPHVLKLGDAKKIKEEFEAAKTMTNLVADAQLLPNPFHHRNDRGALLYKNLATDRDEETATKPSNLAHMLFVRRKSVLCRTAVKKALNKLDNAHKQGREAGEASVAELYSTAKTDYLRERETDSCLERIIGRSRRGDVDFWGPRFSHPRVVLDRLLKRTVRYVRGAVHGDLHPDNIVIDRDDQPHLIDFAWAGVKRDILVDFVLLETSIRFRHFPR